MKTMGEIPSIVRKLAPRWLIEICHAFDETLTKANNMLGQVFQTYVLNFWIVLRTCRTEPIYMKRNDLKLIFEIWILIFKNLQDFWAQQRLRCWASVYHVVCLYFCVWPSLFVVEYLATQTGGALLTTFLTYVLHTQKSTNFGAVSIVEGGVCGKSDGNIKDAHGQDWHTRIGLKFRAHLSAEKIAFPCEVFSKFY